MSSWVLSAQNQSADKDSLVRLLSAKSMWLIEKEGVPLRKVVGPARFFHNNTYLICDTALWNVNEKMIHAMGNVKVIQNETVLTSDSLHYDIDRNLAMFRGALVQLQDKDQNTLRSHFLDYNTRDSIAYFINGAAMRDKDGQLIESRKGEYVSELKTFNFHQDVEMFTDSIFIKTNDLVYYAGRDSVTFGANTNAWKEDYMLSSERGWYARSREQFFFTDQVHGLGPDKEVWADSLYYNRLTNNLEMDGRVQLIDTVHRTTAISGKMVYTDSLSHLLMFRHPAAVGELENNQGAIDSVWFGADTLKYRSVFRFQLPEEFFEASKIRMDNLSSDAVTAYRRKAAEAAREAARKKMKEDPDYEMRPDAKPKNLARNAQPKKEENTNSGELKATVPVKDSSSMEITSRQDSLHTGLDSLQISLDSLGTGADSTSLALDSLGVAADSIATPLDSTKIGFFTGVKNVRVFKSDMQILADSLEMCDVDSLVRLYKRPIIWDQIKRQYMADSLYVQTKNSKLDKANLLSNAFIIIQEDTTCFDQIRSAEMMAYFDSTSALSRFDALGGANAIFYLKEDSTYATVNRSQAKMLSATFNAGEIDHVYYFENSGSDAYPLAQMSKDETILKGFDWKPELRPRSRYDITRERIRPSERGYYESRPKNEFKETNLYFPGYVSSVYKSIEESRLAKQRHKRLEKERQDSLDRLAAVTDSLILSDSLARVDSLAGLDSLKKVAADSLALVDSTQHRDSLSQKGKVLTKQELREAKRKQKEEKARLKREAKEKEWARLDSLDAVKQRIKEEKKAEKIREKKRKALIKAKKRERKEQERLEKYIEKYQQQKAKEEADQLRKAKNKKRKKQPPVLPDKTPVVLDAQPSVLRKGV